MNRKNRTHSASPRHHKPTRPNRTIYIICEGETEEKYFKGYVEEKKLHAIVEVAKRKDIGGTSPKKLLEYAKSKLPLKNHLKNETKDIVYCVFDRDSHSESHDSFRDVYDEIRTRHDDNKDDIRSCVTIECFELWILLHHEQILAWFSCKNCEMEKKVKKIYPWYKKGECKLYENLKDKTETAIKNAKTLSQNIPSNSNANPLPYTEIHKLIIFLEKIVQEREEAKIKNNV